jgi:4-hydroxymandelate oxidase
MESVLPQAASPRWFQLYIYKDRGITGELVRRAEAAGAEAIVVTVDAPGLGTRERDVRNSFRLPDDIAVENLVSSGKGNFPKVTGSGLAAYVRDNFKSDLKFEDLDWLCGCTRLPIVVKGVCRGDDARRAAEHGAKAVVVSNHGGRQLDTAPATCEVLPVVAAAVGDLCEVYVDGGIRRGSDVLKAIALGARAVLIGRPILWGLCAGGEQGATNVLEILRRELDEAMLLCGCTKLGDINRSLLAP